MRVSEGLEDVDVPVQVLLQLLIEAGELDGFDGNQCASNLNAEYISKRPKSECGCVVKAEWTLRDGREEACQAH